MPDDVLWTPSVERLMATKLTAFASRVREKYDANLGERYADLHRWSLEHRGHFWSELWDFADVIGDRGMVAEPIGDIRTARWFPDAQLNFAENLIGPQRNDGAGYAIVSHDETDAGPRRISRAELRGLAMRFATQLLESGVGIGDRVVGLLPNGVEAVVAMLGTTAIGAVWACCSPDFGDMAVIERFAPLSPSVLVTVDGCQYAGKRIDLRARLVSIRAGLPSVRRVLTPDTDPTGSFPVVPFERLPFDQPAFVLFSSGTTGPPKGIVHGSGGTLLQHLKEHQLHCDIGPTDTLLFHTTTGWMMWNWLVSALASRATIGLYDGSPVHPDPATLWRVQCDAGVTHFGAGARYFAAMQKAGVTPTIQETQRLRCILSTGSPLLPEQFDWVYRVVKSDVHLASISGGSDIVSCFVLGVPTEAVRRGEIQAAGLGMDVQVWDDDGNRVVSEPGELVCCSPFPSRPVRFWNDPDGQNYHSAYFGRFPGVWTHGDWATETEQGGFVIHGRSDTTLNPGGVRIGTADIYRQVERFEAVVEALAVPLRRDGDERVVLFVRMQTGHDLSAELVAEIKQRLRVNCSPRHVPMSIVAAPDFPRTVSGKLSEVAVRNSINGLSVKNESALANSASLAFFQEWGRSVA